MKRYLSPLFVVLAAIAMAACDDPANNELCGQERIRQILDRFEKNEGMSYQIFDLLGDRIPADSLTELRKGAAGKEAFIATVARQTDYYFEEVVSGNMSGLDINKVPAPFSGEAEITLKALAATESAGAAPFDMIGAYSSKLLETAKEQAAEGRKDWILLASGGMTSSDPMPAESLSLNFTKVEMLASIPHTVILNLDLTDEQMLSGINDVLNGHEIPPVAIALLLPAVQKIRASGSEAQPFDEAMNAWLAGPVTQAINGGLNRDIIRRIQAAVYLAGLHTLLVDGYAATNQDEASLSILHARYRAAVITGAREVWDH